MRVLLLATAITMMLLLPEAAQAQSTCRGWYDRCMAECGPGRARNPNIPVGCTCELRLNACKQTKEWSSWNGLRRFKVSQ